MGKVEHDSTNYKIVGVVDHVNATVAVFRLPNGDLIGYLYGEDGKLQGKSVSEKFLKTLQAENPNLDGEESPD